MHNASQFQLSEFENFQNFDFHTLLDFLAQPVDLVHVALHLPPKVSV